MNTRRLIERARARSQKMNKARWDANRARIDVDAPARRREIEMAEITGEGRPLKAGEYFGTIEYRDWGGKVHRITLRQGHRKNQLQIDGCKQDHGVTWILDKLRRKIIV